MYGCIKIIYELNERESNQQDTPCPEVMVPAWGTRLFEYRYLCRPAVTVEVCVPAGVRLDHAHLPTDQLRRRHDSGTGIQNFVDPTHIVLVYMRHC